MRLSDLDRRHRPHRIRLHGQRSSFLRLRARSVRAVRLATKMKESRTSARAQARAWSAGSGDSESWKIDSGIDSIGWRGSQVTVFATIEVVNRSGAVSPAARATASTVPVRIPPTLVGKTTPSTV